MAIQSQKGAVSLTVVILILVGCSKGDQNYQNNFDEFLNFECKEKTQAISSISSVHDNRREDRRFAFGCRDVPLARGARNCVTSANWENKHDELLSFHCPANLYIVGMESEHANNREDRRWKFDCCGFEAIILHGCELTDWTNDLDQRQYFRVPTGKVIAGVTSFHVNGIEDRRYKYNICKVGRLARKFKNY